MKLQKQNVFWNDMCLCNCEGLVCICLNLGTEREPEVKTGQQANRYKSSSSMFPAFLSCMTERAAFPTCGALLLLWGRQVYAADLSLLEKSWTYLTPELNLGERDQVYNTLIS